VESTLTETLALVMELVEGPTLADRIARPSTLAQGVPSRVEGRGLPLDEALPIARQIAEALEAAHERGIIHRDLKPANIKLTTRELEPGQSTVNVTDWTVKVLDLGLAKLQAGETGPIGPGRPGWDACGDADEVAATFGVSRAWMHRLAQRRRETGSIAPRKQTTRPAAIGRPTRWSRRSAPPR
jgi:serine/threonine protein kinase